MPMKEAVIHLYGFERPLERRRAMAGKLTQAACEAYDLVPDQVTVYFFDLDPDSTAYAGRLIGDQKLADRVDDQSAA